MSGEKAHFSDLIVESVNNKVMSKFCVPFVKLGPFTPLRCILFRALRDNSVDEYINKPPGSMVGSDLFLVVSFVETLKATQRSTSVM